MQRQPRGLQSHCLDAAQWRTVRYRAGPRRTLLGTFFAAFMLDLAVLYLAMPDTSEIEMSMCSADWLRNHTIRSVPDNLGM